MFAIYSNDGGNTKKVNVTFFIFPGGETHFKILDNFIGDKITIVTDLSDSEEIMRMMLVVDFFKGHEVVLNLKYLPYARQDRKTSLSEPFSLKTMARMINSCGFSEVILNDPHSDVAAALIDNCVVSSRLNIVLETHYLRDILRDKGVIIVSPDAGAMKSNNKIAEFYRLQHISATKVRSVETGEITATQVHTDLDLSGKHLLILDDICDGGRTFIELAKILRTRNPARISLYVTHGIFSNGMSELNKHIDEIFYNHKLGESK